MCGIAGLATQDGLRSADRHLVDTMLGTLAHRGPDDQHAAGDERAWVGARRLSIIDLDGGRQPLTDESGMVIAVQNGEIYNYIELREELEASGHVFSTRSDTETLAHLYEEDGPDLVKRLRGMYALAIWDRTEQRLLLARDRLGKKPLYWRLDDGRLTFGSEIKAIVAEESVERRVDPHALELYLRYQYVPSPHSILEGIRKLPPGHLLLWAGGRPEIRRYWDVSYTPKKQQDERDDVEEGLSILREAVRLRLRSDVPVGVFLSGGMDSSVVTALMAEMSDQPVRTYSIGFESDGFDELPYARAVARHFGTQHTEEIVRIDALELLDELADHYDEPFADSSAVPTYRVAQMASQELKVVLTGDGGDESFGGYTRYRVQRYMELLSRVPELLLRTGARSGHVALGLVAPRSRLRRRFKRIERLAGRSTDELYMTQMSIMDQETYRPLLGGANGFHSGDYLLDVLAAGSVAGMDRYLRADLLTYLPGDLLVKMDRATMANSLEARSPLLDHEVVEWAARLPTERKLKGGTTKVALRAIAHELMPSELIERPKMGFGVPIGDWFEGHLADVFRDLVLAPDSVARDHMDVSVAEDVLKQQATSVIGLEHQLWAILMFELWGRRWLREHSAQDVRAGRST